MSRFRQQMAVAMAALTLLAASTANAAMSGSAAISNVSLQVIDLDLTDGVTAGVMFDTGGYQSMVYTSTTSDHASTWQTKLLGADLGVPLAASSASTGPANALANASIDGGDIFAAGGAGLASVSAYGAGAEAGAQSYVLRSSFVLTPHSQLVLSATGSVNAAASGSGGAALVSAIVEFYTADESTLLDSDSMYLRIDADGSSGSHLPPTIRSTFSNLSDSDVSASGLAWLYVYASSQPVPEPPMAALLGAGLLALLMRRRRWARAMQAGSVSMFRRCFIACAIANVGAGSALAAEISFELTNDDPGVSVSHGVESGARYERGVVGLIDALTGLPQTSGFSASFDDLIRVTVYLANPLTVPPHTNAPANSPGNPNRISVGIGSVNGTVIYNEQDIGFYLNGASVGSGIFSAWGGSGWDLVAGGYTYSSSQGFTFDKIEFSARIIQIFDNDIGDWTNTITVDGIRPTLDYFVFSPVAEPSAGVLMTCGLGGLGLSMLRRRTQRRSLGRTSKFLQSPAMDAIQRDPPPQSHGLLR